MQAAQPEPGAERLPFGDLDERAEQVMVPMRDGVRLATDVYLPRETPAPVILVRLPYDKCGRFSFMPRCAPLATDRGYAFVVQDVRGRIRSEGARFAFVHEVHDGADTLDWLEGRSWCDGNVGMFGDSYYGFTQWAAAASGHPALKAIVPRSTSTPIATDWIAHKEVLLLYQLVEWAAGTWVDEFQYEPTLDWRVRPLDAIVPALHGGRRSRSLDRWVHTPPEDLFWTEGIWGPGPPVLDRIDIPVLSSGGWWDVFQRGQVADHHGLVARGRADAFLLMDATDHYDDVWHEDGGEGIDVGEDDAALEAWLPTYLGPALDLFDRVLRGQERAIAPVRWRRTRGSWEESPTWPPPGAHALHLFPVGASAGPEGGGLAAEPKRAEGRWTHEPGDAVPDLVADAWHPLAGLPDEREVERRSDVLVFVGDALSEPLDLAGPVVFDGVVGSDGPSTHVMAKLVDVRPDGRATRIGQGAALVRDPGEGRAVRVDLGHAGYRLPRGHRLRLDVSASLFPRYWPHPGTDESPWTATRTRPTAQRLALGERTRLSVTVG